MYDWGDTETNLALIHVKLPEAFPLPLAREVKIDENYSMQYSKS